MKPKMEFLILGGIFFIVIGMFLVIAGSLLSQKSDSNVKVGVGGFIGPIPFGFANDRAMYYGVLVVMVFALIVWVVLKQWPG